MGVFTGFVPEGSGIAGSQVVEMAKGELTCGVCALGRRLQKGVRFRHGSSLLLALKPKRSKGWTQPPDARERLLGVD